jgi:hypothetical protein
MYPQSDKKGKEKKEKEKDKHVTMKPIITSSIKIWDNRSWALGTIFGKVARLKGFAYEANKLRTIRSVVVDECSSKRHTNVTRKG